MRLSRVKNHPGHVLAILRSPAAVKTRPRIMCTFEKKTTADNSIFSPVFIACWYFGASVCLEGDI